MTFSRLGLRIVLAVSMVTGTVAAACLFYFRTVEPGLLEATPVEIRVDSMFGKRETIVVQLKNVGGSPVVIADVRSSCGCTVATPKENRIAPGVSTPLKIEVHANTIGRKDAVVGVAYGPSTDRQIVQIPIVIYATEAPGTRVLSFPKDLRIRFDDQGATRTEFQIKTLEQREKEPDLLELTSADERFQFKLIEIETFSAEPNRRDKSDKVERSYRIEVSLSGSETFSATAQMRFREPLAAPTGDIAIIVRPKARTRIVPATVDLVGNQTVPAREKSEVLLISEVDVDYWRLADPEQCPKWLTVEIERLNSNLTRLTLNDSRSPTSQAEGVQLLELQLTSPTEAVSFPVRIRE